MIDKPVIFVAFLEQDNLGVGYMAAMLLKNEIPARIIDYSLGKKSILEQVLQYNPAIIGFSIIFQYHIHDFKDLIDYLRYHGVDCHFSAGGHYPSLRYSELFNLIPELDSVVLFEGEHTFLELVKSIHSESEWNKIHGIAYKDNGSIITNPLQTLESDLDNFPLPVRQPLRKYTFGKKYATILAGRGCYFNCAFCSIREFYSKPPGPVKRIRRPEMVVREMELLHQQLDCSIFMFQDDDFPVFGEKGKEWTTTFCNLLIEKGLSDKVMWKINCRPDEIDHDLFRLMKTTGLFLVYLGIEDGTAAGLKLMNKNITPDISIIGVQILKKLGILYDYGFMLFNPESTFQTIQENLDFLQEICSAGSSPITFCKMLPYAETKIESKLIKEGRLKGHLGFEDYDFLDPLLDDYYSFITDCFENWIAKHDGLLNLTRWARYYSTVYQNYFPITSDFISVNKDLVENISQSNKFFIDTARESLKLFRSRKKSDITANRLRSIKVQVSKTHQLYINLVADNIEKIEILARNIEKIPS